MIFYGAAYIIRLMKNSAKLPDHKLDVRLMAFDLDDTLLTKDCTISPSTIETLRLAAQKGIYVVLCSGRMEDGIMPFVRQLNLEGTEAGRYIIAINGCSIYDLQEKREIYLRNMESEILLKADEAAEKAGYHSEVYSPDTIFYPVETRWTRLDVDLCRVKGKVVENYRQFLKDGKFPKMLIAGEPDRIRILEGELKSMLGHKAVVFTSKPFFLEILPPNCGKGEAILWLAEKLGISREQTAAFGDSMNDESMIRLCGNGIAMCNGLDAIKETADYVTEKDNNNDGAADFIKKFIL